MEEIVIRNPKSVYFNFDWPKYVDENLNMKLDLLEKK